MYIYENENPTVPTIVFLHGISTSSWMWQYQVEQLKNTYHILAPDLPGHGKSNAQPWKSLDDTADRVADLIAERANGGRAHIVGLSLGAYVAIRLMLRASERVDHVILSGLNVLPFPNPLLMKLMGYVMMPIIKTDFMLKANAKGLHISDKDYAEYRESARAMSRTAYLKIGNELMEFRIPLGLEQVQCPTLVLAGENEQGLILQSLPAVVAALPHAQGRVVPGLGHGWNGEAPELFSKVVHTWVTDQPLPHELSLHKT